MRNAPALLRPTFAVLTGFILSGCVNLKPKADTTRFYLLSSMRQAPTNHMTAAQSQVTVGIRRVKIPAYLRSMRLAVRISDEEIYYLDYVPWAENLSTAIQRVLREDLGGLPVVSKVLVNDWRREDLDLELAVEVRRYEVDQTGRVRLRAKWSLTAPGERQPLVARESRAEKSGPSPAADPSGAVRTMSQALDALAGDLADALERLVQAQARGQPAEQEKAP